MSRRMEWAGHAYKIFSQKTWRVERIWKVWHGWYVDEIDVKETECYEVNCSTGLGQVASICVMGDDPRICEMQRIFWLPKQLSPS
jgi:hypothetical protein